MRIIRMNRIFRISMANPNIYPSKVPSQDKYISIRVDREERSNLTVTLVRTTNHTSEVVFSYSRAQVVESFYLKLPHVYRSKKVLFSDGAKLPQ